MGAPVTHFEVVGRDAQALQAFYRDAFGWQMVPSLPSYAMAHPGGTSGINGGVGAMPGIGPDRVTFYIEVQDLDGTLARVEELGGRRLVGPVDVPNGPCFALFTDPEGHVVGLARTRSAQAAS